MLMSVSWFCRRMVDVTSSTAAGSVAGIVALGHDGAQDELVLDIRIGMRVFDEIEVEPRRRRR